MEPGAGESNDPLRGWRGVVVLIAGLFAVEIALFLPCFTGERVLAPTEFLAELGPFPEADASKDSAFPINGIFSDSIEQFLPWLRFAATELRAGRMPLWNPHTYCGTPFLANNQSSIFCPFHWIYFAYPSPHALIWVHFAKSFTGALGAFLFLRILGVRSVCALLGGWIFPCSGTAMLWLYHPQSSAFAWLPWSFWAVERMVQKPRGVSGAALATILALNILSGHLETTAHILTAAACYGVIRWIQVARNRERATGEARRIFTQSLLATLIGFGIGAIQLLPTLDYLKSSHRLQLRAEGRGGEDLERSSWEIVRIGFPMLFGSKQHGSFERTGININESGANGYIGFLTLAVLAPIGLSLADRNATRWIWLFLAILFAAPLLEFPILARWHDIPPFSSMRAPRAVMITGWCFLCLAVLGFDHILAGRASFKRIIIGQMFLLGMLAFRFKWLGTRIANGLMREIPAEAIPFFKHFFSLAAILCVLGAGILLLIAFQRRPRMFVAALLLAVCTAELVGTFWRYHPQRRPQTYYPHADWLETIRQQQPDYRFCGIEWFLMPEIATYYGLNDVRGYDGVDPAPIIELLQPLNKRESAPYASLLYFLAEPSPILDMLAVKTIYSRYPQDEQWHSKWKSKFDPRLAAHVANNPHALKRAYVPTAVVSVPDARQRLATIHSAEFRPADLAIVSEPLANPLRAAKGDAKFLKDDPCEVVLEAQMESEGLLVIADSWSEDWKVHVDDQPAQAFQANHAIRGVVVPAGKHIVRWTYEPAKFYLGCKLAATACALLTGWIFVAFFLQRRKSEISE